MNPAAWNALHEAYRHCENRMDVMVIVLDALDQAGAPLRVQQAVRQVLNRWDFAATDEARRVVEAQP